MSARNNNSRNNRSNSRSNSTAGKSNCRSSSKGRRFGKTAKNNYQDLAEEKEFMKGKRSGDNDASWYTKYPEIANPANSVPFSWPVGQSLDLNPTIAGDTKYSFTMPGVFALYLLPSVGKADSATDPINIATQDLYSMVRKSQTGRTNYDPQDLMIYTLAMANVYSYINYLMRVYGSMFISTAQNKYTPRALVSAQWVDYDDVLINLADFRAGINQLIVAASSFNVPASMDYFRRAAFLYQNIYIEGPTFKQAMYLYSPRGFYKYSEGTSDDPAGKLTTADFYQATPHTVAQLLQFGFSLIQPLKGSQDAGIISGDLGKAFEGNLIQLQFLPEQYALAPIYSEEVLQQFRNAVIPVMPGNLFTTRFLLNSVTQSIAINDSYLVSMPAFASVNANVSTPRQKLQADAYFRFMSASRLLNVMPEWTTPGGVAVATRLMIGADGTAADLPTTETGYTAIAGTEIPISATIYTFNNETKAELAIPVYSLYFNSTDAAESAADPLQINWTNFFNRSAFHYAPAAWLCTISGSGANVSASLSAVDADFDTYSIIDIPTLSQIHRSALYSLMMP